MLELCNSKKGKVIVVAETAAEIRFMAASYSRVYKENEQALEELRDMVTKLPCATELEKRDFWASELRETRREGIAGRQLARNMSRRGREEYLLSRAANGAR